MRESTRNRNMKKKKPARRKTAQTEKIKQKGMGGSRSDVRRIDKRDGK